MSLQLLEALVCLNIVCHIEDVVVALGPVVLEEFTDIDFVTAEILPQVCHNILVGNLSVVRTWEQRSNHFALVQ